MTANLDTKKHVKRDALREIEVDTQKFWENEKMFQTDPPQDVTLTWEELQKKYPKFLATFPYPYMNGRLHLGHTFSLSKAEFIIGYLRMKGFRCLFPLGFHCTGMPIKACADKLKAEIEKFGADFERYSEIEEEEIEASRERTASGAKVKSKVAAKSNTKLKYQFQIMESIGIPRVEIKRFAETGYWLQYFPPRAIADLKKLGLKIDWRRSFITTDANPYYDSFVRYQMNRLHKLDYIKFGERYTIYSPKDGQPCMDHDRQSGEGVAPQEYTCIKLKVIAWSAQFMSHPQRSLLEGKDVFFVPATLRPETMYGQTNCFVSPSIVYGFYSVSEKEVYIMTERAATNMAYQGITASAKKGEKIALLETLGENLIGSKVFAPLSIYKEVYILPMDTVLATKGTGVVTSVPSNSPADYATVMDLIKKPDYYKIKAEWIEPFTPVPIINSPSYGNLAAVKVCEMKKINSPKDKKLLDEAKDMVYKEDFYGGTMIIGDYQGKSVQDAKPLIRTKLISQKEAFVYYEPESLVMSRSGDECVVALTDQWYLDYGLPDWKDLAKKCLAKVNTYTPECRHQFEKTLSWLHEWACARSFGLGTKLPWDPQFLVESLSDSTIYMSYYTVSHLLQEGSLDGSKPGPLNIKAEELTDEVWYYILHDEAPFPQKTTIGKDKLDLLKRQFQYFYPFDLRVSGKDLVPNHLSFLLFNHVAMFPESRWPKSIRANGHLLLNNEKMSKSTGNFLTLNDAVDMFGADATRFALADAGDSIEDANFLSDTANSAILRLFTQKEWIEETMASLNSLRTGPVDGYLDQVFWNEMKHIVNLAEKSYDGLLFRDALMYSFYELQNSRDYYREATAITGEGMHKDLILKFIEVQALVLQPLTPHWSEYIWRQVLKKNGSVTCASWPTFDVEVPVNTSILSSVEYLRGLLKTVRSLESTSLKKKGKNKGGDSYDPSKPKSAKLFIAKSFPSWQEEVLSIMKQNYDNSQNVFNEKELMSHLGQKGMAKDKKVMPFVHEIKKQVSKFGESTFNRGLVFDEHQILQKNQELVKKSLGLEELEIIEVIAGMTLEDSEDMKKADLAVPGQPTLRLWNC